MTNQPTSSATVLPANTNRPLSSSAGTPEEDKGFWASLADFSFNYFITPKIVVFLYAVGILGGLLVMAFFMLTALGVTVGGSLGGARASQAAGFGLFMLILAPLGFFLYVVVLRLYLEVTVVLFQIATNTRDTARNTLR